MAYSRCLIMKNKPRIRFKGFTEDWEQRKLRDLLEQPITDGPHETPELYDSGIPFISVDAIVDNKIDFTKMRGYISKEYDDICAKKYKPRINDVYLVKSGATIGKVAIVDTYDDFNIWSPLAAMRCGSITNPYFLYILLQTQDLQSQVFNKASNGTQPNLSMRQLETFTCKVPKIEEQKLISRFLKQLDNFITLHQRKLEKLKLAKKALLQKLFPKNGSQFPAIRFKGFTDAWEQRKFGEIYERAGQKNDLTYGIDKIISVANMYFKKDVTVGSEEYLKTYNVFKLGDIAFEGHTNKEYRYGRFVENTIGDGIVSHIFDVFTPKINLDINFWKDLIKYEPIMGPILRRCTKASRMMSNLTTKEFLEEQILCPTLEEQKLIGEFIVNLDNIITLHQRKLDKLQEVKKGLLQKMFV